MAPCYVCRDAENDDLLAMLTAADAGSTDFGSLLQQQAQPQTHAQAHQTASWSSLPAAATGAAMGAGSRGGMAEDEGAWHADPDPSANFGMADNTAASQSAEAAPWHAGQLVGLPAVPASWQQPPAALQDQQVNLPHTSSGGHEHAPLPAMQPHGPHATPNSMPPSWQQPAAPQYPHAPFGLQPSLPTLLLATPPPVQQPASAQTFSFGSPLPQEQPPLHHLSASGVAGHAALPPPSSHTASAYDEGFAAGLRAAKAQLAATAHQPVQQQQQGCLASHTMRPQAPIQLASLDSIAPSPIHLAGHPPPSIKALAGAEGGLDELLSLMGIAS